MSNIQRDSSNPFYLNGKRAMVSLGPLNQYRHCPFRCAFCYVQDGFCSYANLDISATLSFLHQNRSKYSIIYVSGDTDSFAPPRTSEGLKLLHSIANEIDCDLLFTTRTTFNDADYSILGDIASITRTHKRNLYACVSITRYSDNLDYLEPRPIPSPDERISVLKRLKTLGAVTVLATRPFLPVVPVSDYFHIIELCKDFVDIVLGESFYFIRGGAIEKRVFLNGISSEIECDISKNNKMVFDDNNENWDIWDSIVYQTAVREKCAECGIIFSMHSDDAIAEYISKS